MKTIYLFLVLLSTSTLYLAQSTENELKKIIDRQEMDWNKNDMKSFSQAFSADATLINFLGMYWKGRENIVEQFAKINECCIKPTSVKYEWMDSKILSPNSAYATIKETLTAKEDYAVPGGMVKKGTVNDKIITAVFEKTKNTWKIVSMQVTQVSPMPK